MKRALLLSMLLSGCIHAPAEPGEVAPRPGVPPLQALQEMEQTRTLQAEGVELAGLTHSDEPGVRSSALIVVGRLQRPELVGAVVAELAPPHPALVAAAWAAGQYGLAWQPLPKEQLARLSSAVQGALATAQEPEARAALLNALGKLAQPESARALLDALRDSSPNVRLEAAQALGLLAYATKGAAPDASAIDPLNALLLHDPDAQVRFAAAYALMRSKRPEAQPGLVFGLKDGDGRVRAVCARGLADGTALPDAQYLLERLGDPELDVRVEAARALGKRASRCKAADCPEAALALKALSKLATSFDPAEAESAMPLLALVQEKLPASMAPQLPAAEAALPKGKNPEEAHAWAIVAGYVAAALDATRTDATTPNLDKLAVPAELGPWREALAIRTLGDSAADAALRAKALLARPVVGVQAAGSVDDALGELKQNTPEVRARILADLRSPDWGITLSAADAAGKLALADAVPDLLRALTVASVNEQHDAVATILQHLVALHAPQAPELARRLALDPRVTVRAGALEALKTLGQPAPGGEPEPLDFHMPRLDGERTAVVTTARGVIKLRLHAGSFTAQNFVDLASRGFFDQLVFHRVVPGFVVQGGDPRGDGSGGPGYSIPCELDGSRYVRGAVGMALAGKDTGGSQFFITLAPQPHLEGRYAIFADVSKGMEVADQLVEGDRILSITVEPEAPTRPSSPTNPN